MCSGRRRGAAVLAGVGAGPPSRLVKLAPLRVRFRPNARLPRDRSSSEETDTSAVVKKTTLAAALALIGFAGNSILCRTALSRSESGESAIDPWSFTAVRLVGGAVVLVSIAVLSTRRKALVEGGTLAGSSFVSGAALFAYAAAFSLAYLHLSAGVGALVLFACVQVTMIGWGIRGGERLGPAEWLGIALALAGLGVLAARGDATASPIGLALMAIAGIAWGAYSIRGRASRSPLLTTAGNFAWSVPLALAGLLVGGIGERGALHVSARGVWLALASGTLASGLGYSLWYLALPAISAKRAALVQLLVPVIAAGAGVLLLGERLTLRLAIAAVMILCGVGLAILRRGSKPARPAHAPASSSLRAGDPPTTR